MWYNLNFLFFLLILEAFESLLQRLEELKVSIAKLQERPRPQPLPRTGPAPFMIAGVRAKPKPAPAPRAGAYHTPPIKIVRPPSKPPVYHIKLTTTSVRQYSTVKPIKQPPVIVQAFKRHAIIGV